MKLIKTASGKKKIKISKREWKSIGKKAGWMKSDKKCKGFPHKGKECNQDAADGLDYCDECIVEYKADEKKQFGGSKGLVQKKAQMDWEQFMLDNPRQWREVPSQYDDLRNNPQVWQKMIIMEANRKGVASARMIMEDCPLMGVKSDPVLLRELDLIEQNEQAAQVQKE